MMMIIMTMMRLLNSTRVTKNAWPRKQKQKKKFYPLPGTHQDGGIGVFLKMKKGIQKNCGDRYRLS